MTETVEVTEEQVRQWLIESVAQILIMPYDSIDCEAHLSELGMDSQEMLSLIGKLEDWLGCRLPSSVSEEPGSINKLVQVAMNVE